MRILTKNLAFTALYKVVSIPLALAYLLPLLIASLGIIASSCVVVYFFKSGGPPLGKLFFDHKHCPRRSELCTCVTPPALDISYDRMYVKTNVFALMCYCSQ